MLHSRVDPDIKHFCPSLTILRALVDMGIHKMPEPNPPDKEYWETEAIMLLLDGLSEANWIRLKKVAAYRSLFVPVGADDLLQEAIVRALSGERRCPKEVTIVKFLAETMRSIASASAKSFSKKPGSVQLSDFEEHSILQSATQEKPKSIEEIICSEGEAKEIKEKIFGLFEQDEIATMILMGRVEEMPANEIQSMLGIDQVKYQSKSKYIRRTINKNFPNGWRK